MKSGMEVTPLEGIPTSYFSISTPGNNMEDAKIYEIRMTPLPFNIESRNDVW
jgi:hypothetical protein